MTKEMQRIIDAILANNEDTVRNMIRADVTILSKDIEVGRVKMKPIHFAIAARRANMIDIIMEEDTTGFYHAVKDSMGWTPGMFRKFIDKEVE